MCEQLPVLLKSYYHHSWEDWLYFELCGKPCIAKPCIDALFKTPTNSTVKTEMFSFKEMYVKLVHLYDYCHLTPEDMN